MTKQNYEKMHYIFAGIVTFLILFSGILIGNAISSAKVGYAQQLNAQLTLESRSIQLKHTLAGSDICSLFNPESLFGELYDVGAKLDYLEGQRKENDPEVAQLKEYYQILEIENWLLIEEYQKECSGSDVQDVLYFYSNNGDCPTCEQQGYALTFLRTKYAHTYVFSFDINKDNPAINLLKQIYNISEAPSIVIRDKTHVGLLSANEVIAILEESSVTNSTQEINDTIELIEANNS